MFSYHKPLLGEPDFDSAEDLRLFRKRRVAIGYRVFAALGWGHTGDGHITARDPERTDHFWLLGHGVPFGSATVDQLVMVAPDGSVVPMRMQIASGEVTAAVACKPRQRLE